MADIFIPYKRRMRPEVACLAEVLRALKLTVWFDAGVAADKGRARVSALPRSRSLDSPGQLGRLCSLGYGGGDGNALHHAFEP